MTDVDARMEFMVKRNPGTKRPADKLAEATEPAASATSEVPVGWRRTAKCFWWLVLLLATAISVKGNLTHADAVSPAEFRALAEVIGGGSPVALLVMIEGAELGLLARAHGVARTVGLALLVPLAAIVFATSYAGLLYVVTESELAQNPTLRYSLAAVPDLLMVTATVYLIALRSTGNATAKPTSESPWRRTFQAVGETVAARAQAAADRQHRGTGPSVRPADPANAGISASPGPVSNPVTEGTTGPANLAVPTGDYGIDAGQNANPSGNSRANTGSDGRNPVADAAGEGLSDPLMAEAEGLRTDLRMRLDTASVAEILRQLDDGSEPVEVARELNIDPKTVRKVSSARHQERRLTSVG